MNKEDIIKYVMHTPQNTNYSVLNSILDQYAAGGGGGDSYTVTISLDLPQSPAYFNKFEIYEWDLNNYQIGQKIGEITSVIGSTTITTSSNAIWCKLYGGYVLPPLALYDVTCSQGIGFNLTADGSDGDAYMAFIIAKSGSIDITNINWND